MSVTYAAIATQEAFLFTQWGEDLARNLFGDKLDTLPKFVRGKHVGKYKGKIIFHRVQRGGWVRELGGGHVERRLGKIISAELCTAPFAAEHKILHYWTLET